MELRRASSIVVASNQTASPTAARRGNATSPAAAATSPAGPSDGASTPTSGKAPAPLPAAPLAAMGSGNAAKWEAVSRSDDDGGGGGADRSCGCNAGTSPTDKNASAGDRRGCSVHPPPLPATAAVAPHGPAAPPPEEDGPWPSTPESPSGAAVAPTQVLVLFVLLKVLTSYDGGAFTASLAGDYGIAVELGLSPAEGGALGASVFLGNLVGCVLAGVLFGRYSARSLMLLAMAGHAVTTAMFSISQSFEMGILVRFLLGITIAFPVVYSPVWVEGHAPSRRRTTWMALCNAGVPIGAMVGFVVAGLVPSKLEVSWRWAFHVKSFCMVPCMLAIARCNVATFDSHAVTLAAAQRSASTDDRGLSDCDEARTALSGLLSLLRSFLRNGLFVTNVLALCALYFIVTGLQTFLVAYLRGPPFYAPMTSIVAGFGFTVITAPVLGVVCGGILIDRLGGYHGNLRMATSVMAIWGVACAFFSAVTSVATTLVGFLACLWLLMFCGGAIVPVGTGIIMASVDESHRAAASSVSVVVFNLLGYFLGPMVCGAIADATTLATGIKVMLWMAVPAVTPMLVGMRLGRAADAAHHLRHATAAGATELSSSAFGDARIVNVEPRVVGACDGEREGTPPTTAAAAATT